MTPTTPGARPLQRACGGHPAVRLRSVTTLGLVVCISTASALLALAGDPVSRDGPRRDRDTLREVLLPQPPASPTSPPAAAPPPDLDPRRIPPELLGDEPRVPDLSRRDFGPRCLEAGCHAGLRRSPTVHEPVAVGACDTCHVDFGEAPLHLFRDARDPGELCSHCHRQPSPDEYRHEPFEKGNCIGCHDPHGGDTRSLLRSSDDRELCFGECHEIPVTDALHEPVAQGKCRDCHLAHQGPRAALLEDSPAAVCGSCHEGEHLAFGHDPFTAGDCLECHRGHSSPHPALATAPGAQLCEQCHGPDLHADLHLPVLEGECLTCHDAHESPRGALLVADEDALCLTCHEEIESDVAQRAHAHPALDGGCLSCHCAHGGEPGAALVHGSRRDLCTACHAEVVERAAEHGHVHEVLATDRGCETCHLPHASDRDHLMPDRVAERCYGCHDEAITMASGHRIAALAGTFERARVQHDPVVKGNCEACHKGHDTDAPRLLRGHFPISEYARFDDETYELCLSCHEQEILLDEHSLATDFRDGDVNLHYVHVHRQKGRTCLFCHEAHVSERPHLMREQILFGPVGWEVQVRYEENERGGSCGVSCHQARTYDNTSPVIRGTSGGAEGTPR